MSHFVVDVFWGLLLSNFPKEGEAALAYVTPITPSHLFRGNASCEPDIAGLVALL